MHDEDNDCKAVTAAAANMDHNEVDTISLKDIMGSLPLFLSAKFMIVAISE